MPTWVARGCPFRRERGWLQAGNLVGSFGSSPGPGGAHGGLETQVYRQRGWCIPPKSLFSQRVPKMLSSNRVLGYFFNELIP